MNDSDDQTQAPHYSPQGFSDRFAYALVRFMRFFADVFLQGVMATERWCWKPLQRCRAWLVGLCSICTHYGN